MTLCSRNTRISFRFTKLREGNEIIIINSLQCIEREKEGKITRAKSYLHEINTNKSI